MPALSEIQLLTIAVLFFLAELAMTFVVAFVVQRLGDIKPAFEDAYKLAVVVPTPLWLAHEGHAILLSGSILAAGLVAWVAMMYLTLISWSWVGSSLLLLI